MFYILLVEGKQVTVNEDVCREVRKIEKVFGRRKRIPESKNPVFGSVEPLITRKVWTVFGGVSDPESFN